MTTCMRIVFVFLLSVVVTGFQLIQVDNVRSEENVMLISGNVDALGLDPIDCESEDACRAIYEMHWPEEDFPRYFLRLDSIKTTRVFTALKNNDIHFRSWLHVMSTGLSETKFNDMLSFFGWVNMLFPSSFTFSGELLVVEDVGLLSKAKVREKRRDLIKTSFPQWDMQFAELPSKFSRAFKFAARFRQVFPRYLSRLPRISADAIARIPLQQPLVPIRERSISESVAHLNPLYSISIDQVPSNAHVILVVGNDPSGVSSAINRLTKCNLPAKLEHIFACEFRQTSAPTYLLALPQLTEAHMKTLADSLQILQAQVIGLLAVDIHDMSSSLDNVMYTQLLQVFYLMPSCFQDAESRVVYVNVENGAQNSIHRLENKIATLEKEFPSWEIQGLRLKSRRANGNDIMALEQVLQELHDETEHCPASEINFSDVKGLDFTISRKHFPLKSTFPGKKIRLSLFLSQNHAQMVHVINHLANCDLRVADLNRQRAKVFACPIMTRPGHFLVPVPLNANVTKTDARTSEIISKTLQAENYEIERVIVLSTPSEDEMSYESDDAYLWKYVNDWFPTCFHGDETQLTFMEMETPSSLSNGDLASDLALIEDAFPQWSLDGQTFSSYKDLHPYFNTKLHPEERCKTSSMTSTLDFKKSLQPWEFGREALKTENPLAQRELLSLPEKANLVLVSSRDANRVIQTINQVTKCDLDVADADEVGACEYRKFHTRVFFVPVHHILQDSKSSLKFYNNFKSKQWQIKAFLYLDSDPQSSFIDRRTFSGLNKLFPTCFLEPETMLFYFHRSKSGHLSQTQKQKEASFTRDYPFWEAAAFHTMHKYSWEEIEKAMADAFEHEKVCLMSSMKNPTKDFTPSAAKGESIKKQQEDENEDDKPQKSKPEPVRNSLKKQLPKQEEKVQTQDEKGKADDIKPTPDIEDDLEIDEENPSGPAKFKPRKNNDTRVTRKTRVLTIQSTKASNWNKN